MRRSGGADALNVINYPPDRLIGAELATIAEVFTHAIVVSPPSAIAGGLQSTVVAFASQAPPRVDGVRSRRASRSKPATVVAGEDLRSFVDGAPILTDDYAPVDQWPQRP